MRKRCIVGAALCTITVLLGSACRDSTNDRLNELPDETAIIEGELTPAEFADVVRIVGDGDVPDETKRAAAEGAVHYLDDIADAAEEGSRDDFARPDIIRFATELGHDKQAVLALINSFVVWVQDEINPLITTSDPDPADVSSASDVFAPVLGALSAGVGDSPQAEINGRPFDLVVVRDLVESTARAIAEQSGSPEPDPDQYDQILDQHFPMYGHPLDDLDLAASDHGTDRDEGSHWW